MRLVCSWQRQSTSKKIMGTEETPHGVYFLCGKSKPLGKKMPSASTADIVLIQLDKQDTKYPASQNTSFYSCLDCGYNGLKFLLARLPFYVTWNCEAKQILVSFKQATKQTSTDRQANKNINEDGRRHGKIWEDLKGEMQVNMIKLHCAHK